MENNESHVQVDRLIPEDNIAPEIQGEVPLEMLEPDVYEDYSPTTPEQKVGPQVGQDDFSETFLIGSETGSSDVSAKDSSEIMSYSPSSSDAESATYNLAGKKYLQLFDNGNEDDDDVLKPKMMGDDNVDEKENLSQKMKDAKYEELLERVANYEIELKFTKKKLQSKQEETARMKYENLTLVEELGRTVEKLRASEDEMVKMEQKYTTQLEQTQHLFKTQLELANGSIDLLQTELISERKLVTELQETLVKNTGDLCEYSREIDELKHALHEAQQDFSKDRTCFHSEKAALEERILKYEARELGLVDEIRQLKTNLFESSETVESLTRTLDDSKLKLDTIMSEKDGLFAKVQSLNAELSHRDICMQQKEDQIGQLTSENFALLAELKKTQEVIEQLKMTVNDHEKELEGLKLVISDRAEEKREAIRQLCFSLEHYRNGYEELREAIIKHKRPAVLGF